MFLQTTTSSYFMHFIINAFAFKEKLELYYCCIIKLLIMGSLDEQLFSLLHKLLILLIIIARSVILRAFNYMLHLNLHHNEPVNGNRNFRKMFCYSRS